MFKKFIKIILSFTLLVVLILFIVSFLHWTHVEINENGEWSVYYWRNPVSQYWAWEDKEVEIIISAVQTDTGKDIPVDVELTTSQKYIKSKDGNIKLIFKREDMVLNVKGMFVYPQEPHNITVELCISALGEMDCRLFINE